MPRCPSLHDATAFPTLSHRLGLPGQDLGVTLLVVVASGAHEAADGAAVAIFVPCTKGEREESLGKAPVPIWRVGLLAAQGGHQLPEGGV